MGQVFRFCFLSFLIVCGAGCSGEVHEIETNYSGDTLQDFSAALTAGDVKKVSTLLDVEPSLLELRDGEGLTPIHYAARKNRAEVITLLVERGMDPNVRDNAGRTALTLIDEEGLRLDAAREVLLDHGGTN
jgi:ankyrin repeat protein